MGKLPVIAGRIDGNGLSHHWQEITVACFTGAVYFHGVRNGGHCADRDHVRFGQFAFWVRAKNLWLDIFTGGITAIDRTFNLQLGVEVFARRAGGSDNSRRTDRIGHIGIFHFERNANTGNIVRRRIDPCGNLSRFATNKSKLNRKARQGCKDDRTQKHEPQRTRSPQSFLKVFSVITVVSVVNA